MDWIAWAQKVRPLIVKASESLDEQDISQAPTLCDTLHGDGRAIKAGTRINWHGTVKKAAVTLWDRPDSWPDAAPNLWENLPYKDGIRIIPEVITPGLAFQPGEKGWWGDQLYESILPTANTYTPDQYMPGWKLIK